MQRCGSCKEEKAQGEFNPSAAGVIGAWCRACKRAAWHGTRVVKPHPAVECCWCSKSYVPKAVRPNSVFLCSRKCNEARRKAQGRDRRSRLLREYGITPEDYDRMLAEQGGGCALCGLHPEGQRRYSKYLHIDHCHETGKVRGLLCDQHNLLLGRWDHDPALLRRAASYLEAPASD